MVKAGHELSGLLSGQLDASGVERAVDLVKAQRAQVLLGGDRQLQRYLDDLLEEGPARSQRAPMPRHIRAMPSREQDAASNVRAALSAAGVAFELKDLARVADGYAASFQMGMVTHVEAGIDEAVVEDVPPTEALTALIRKVQAVFAEMT